MAYDERSRDRRRSAKKLFMNAPLALIVAGGVSVFVLSSDNRPAEPQQVATQGVETPDFDPQPYAPPDKPLPQPAVPPLPTTPRAATPDAAPQAQSPAPMPTQPVEPTPLP
jgi:hypothetical protein